MKKVSWREIASVRLAIITNILLIIVCLLLIIKHGKRIDRIEERLNTIELGIL
jgi:hypothetical protein